MDLTLTKRKIIFKYLRNDSPFEFAIRSKMASQHRKRKKFLNIERQFIYFWRKKTRIFIGKTCYGTILCKCLQDGFIDYRSPQFPNFQRNNILLKSDFTKKLPQIENTSFRRVHQGTVYNFISILFYNLYVTIILTQIPPVTNIIIIFRLK